MFLEFIHPLVAFFTPFNVIQYLSFRGAYAAITSLLLCFIFGPRIIAALLRFKIGQSVRKDGPQSHLKKDGTPTMGGIFLILSILIAMLLWMDFRNWYVWLVLGALTAFGLIGFLDDYLKVARHNSAGLPAWAKLIFQFAVSLTIVLILYNSSSAEITYLYIPFFKNPVVDMGRLWIPFAVLLIMGSSNAGNITDGLDGLLAGLLILVFLTFAILTYLSGHFTFSSYLGIPFIPGAGELSVFSLAIVGALIGFLWFNATPAEVFLGDVGSLSLGGVAAVLSLIIKREILFFIIGGVFVLEIASVIIQVAVFKLRGKRVFKMAPWHHHAELSGWAESKVVIRFWILGGLFTIIALSTLKIQ
ncbi:MAG: phospho-N-acetylmuramoyl-pentapeptide-transferase [Treponema sp.]|nr:phospho-N-acetylmuramoyl-pentapeptide-transferase [Treponema sp.]